MHQGYLLLFSVPHTDACMHVFNVLANPRVKLVNQIFPKAVNIIPES